MVWQSLGETRSSTFGVFPSVASRVRSRSWEGGAMKTTYGLRLEDLNTCSDLKKNRAREMSVAPQRKGSEDRGGSLGRVRLSTRVCRHSKQMRPELMTCRTESVLVPYKFFSNSPNSTNFPAAMSDSKALRLTKWYSRPFRSCIRRFLVVSVPSKRWTNK